MKQFTTFFIGDTYFGINILQVQEINSQTNFTPVPDSSEYIRGLLNLRGQIITVFDMSKRLGREGINEDAKTRNLILKTDNQTEELRREGLVTSRIGNDAVGFLVDKIGDVVEVEEEDIKPAPANIGEVSNEFVEGIVELDDKLLIIVNVEELVNINNKDE